MKCARPGFHLCCCQWSRVFFIFCSFDFGALQRFHISVTLMPQAVARAIAQTCMVFGSLLGSRLSALLSALGLARYGSRLGSQFCSRRCSPCAVVSCVVLLCVGLRCAVLCVVRCVVLCCFVSCAFWHLVLCCDALCCAVLLLHAVLSCILHLLRLCARGWLCLRVALRCACVCYARCCSMRTFENIKKVLPFLVTNP